MKLEEATIHNTCEYSLTGMVVRAKVLWVMGCNSSYAILAVEKDEKIYKIYVWSTGQTKYHRVGKIFYTKIGNRDSDRCFYNHEPCDKSGVFLRTISPEYAKHFEPEYGSIFDVKDTEYDTDEDIKE